MKKGNQTNRQRAKYSQRIFSTNFISFENYKTEIVACRCATNKNDWKKNTRNSCHSHSFFGRCVISFTAMQLFQTEKDKKKKNIFISLISFTLDFNLESMKFNCIKFMFMNDESAEKKWRRLTMKKQATRGKNSRSFCYKVLLNFSFENQLKKRNEPESEREKLRVEKNISSCECLAMQFNLKCRQKSIKWTLIRLTWFKVQFVSDDDDKINTRKNNIKQWTTSMIKRYIKSIQKWLKLRKLIVI